MKSYSLDFREKIVKAYEKGDTSVRKVASQFLVSKSFVQKLLYLQKIQGHVKPAKPGPKNRGGLNGYAVQLEAMVAKYPDASLSEYCEYFGQTYKIWVSSSTMCRALTKQELTQKKRHYAAAKPELKESNF